jgi:hypothetical protein
LQLSLDGKLLKEWKSATVAAKELKISRKAIYACAQGLRKTHKKHMWKYKNTDWKYKWENISERKHNESKRRKV